MIEKCSKHGETEFYVDVYYTAHCKKCLQEEIDKFLQRPNKRKILNKCSMGARLNKCSMGASVQKSKCPLCDDD